MNILIRRLQNKILLIILFSFFNIILPKMVLGVSYTEKRKPNSYFVSGDSFRAYCDFVFDETDTSLNPLDVINGSIIFVKTDYISNFFKKIHPYIKSKYIIVTQNSDDSVPGNNFSFLDDERIIAWFGQNVDGYLHPKLHPIPLGIANNCWPHGNTKLIEKVKNEKYLKEHLLYLNIAIGTFRFERSLVQNLYKDKSFCYVTGRKNFENYLVDLTSSKFVLAPRGYGLDTHRLWESLYLGVIPIVKTSSLDHLYSNLPVLIVQDWNELNDEFLEKKYREMNSKKYLFEKLDINYWLNLIDSYRKNYLYE